ncbi:2-phosphoxylose phosphatase 1 [Cylas formicarius]|uniref:2-phosphoxylose phosphatase 1 n=1 Tax=Cylas formicarius TaxID=197179 RepID=UPI0029583E10|nr:2-phosphoxylose phosphatase 1 [Cylas formicarius]
MTVRTNVHNRAFYCYVVLSIWILLLVAGVYRFFEWHYKESEPAVVTTELFNNLGIADARTKRIFKICNFPDEIYQGDEGILNPNKWVLKGLIVLIRHGDRGPLEHIKKIANLNCNTEETHILSLYKSYVHNLTVTGKIQWTGPGPFHGFSVLPTNPNQCLLGQLTMQGISQLLNLGRVMGKSYREVWPKLAKLKPEEVLVHSTRYKRTFQSVLAFLYGLVHYDTVTKINILESQSMSFCFKDCVCPVTDSLTKFVRKSSSFQLQSHPAVATLSDATGQLLFSSEAEKNTFANDPYAVRDALLAFICHRSGLPCESPQNCIKRHNIAGIMAYTDWVNYHKWKNIHWRRLCLLRSYGLMRHIVQQMLHMVSNNGPYLVVYSGHDHTLAQLTTALGLANDPLLLRYAARVVVEVYQDNRQSRNDAKGIYFRLLSNGKDVTRQINFCRNLVNVDRKNSVCKMEDIVRFLHDDYFSTLNVTNFKDACARRDGTDKSFVPEDADYNLMKFG